MARKSDGVVFLWVNGNHYVIHYLGGLSFGVFFFYFGTYANFSFDQIDAAKPIPEVFEDVKAIFAPYAPQVIYLF